MFRVAGAVIYNRHFYPTVFRSPNSRAMSRHDLRHQLVISWTYSRFLKVPTIRLGRFPYL